MSSVLAKSKSLTEATLKSRHLYRRAMRSAPRIIQLYELPYSVDEVRKRIAQEFKKHKNLDDVETINMLWAKGKMELDETLMFWKQRGHILRYFGPRQQEEDGFLEKFFNNTL